MNRYILILSILVLFVNANQVPSPPQNANPSKEPQDMNAKIKGIAQGIVNKWVAEGLKVTKDKVEGWIDILDKSQPKGKKPDQNNAPTTNNKQNAQKSQINNPEGLGGDFKEVRDTLVKTFTNIGKAKCENCKKPSEATKNALPKTENQRLENLSIDELKQKQESIKQLMQMEKISKLANVANKLSDFGKLKDIANLAKSLKTLTTPREEL